MKIIKDVGIIGAGPAGMSAALYLARSKYSFLLIEKEETADDLFEEATQQAKKAGLIEDGDIVVLTAGVPLGKAGTTNMLRVIEV